MSIILSDKSIKPSDDLIFSIIGGRKDLWQSLMKHADENYTGSAGDWNYYNDGKRWLFKLVRKKKTVFWISLIEDTFQVTFYFGDKAEPMIDKSDLPEKIKDEFKSAKRYGAIRGITVIMKEVADVKNVAKLMAIKSALK
jgi:hypothetical protein